MRARLCRRTGRSVARGFRIGRRARQVRNRLLTSTPIVSVMPCRLPTASPGPSSPLSASHRHLPRLRDRGDRHPHPISVSCERIPSGAPRARMARWGCRGRDPEAARQRRGRVGEGACTRTVSWRGPRWRCTAGMAPRGEWVTARRGAGGRPPARAMGADVSARGAARPWDAPGGARARCPCGAGARSGARGAPPGPWCTARPGSARPRP